MNEQTPIADFFSDKTIFFSFSFFSDSLVAFSPKSFQQIFFLIFSIPQSRCITDIKLKWVSAATDTREDLFLNRRNNDNGFSQKQPFLPFSSFFMWFLFQSNSYLIVHFIPFCSQFLFSLFFYFEEAASGWNKKERFPFFLNSTRCVWKLLLLLCYNGSSSSSKRQQISDIHAY